MFLLYIKLFLILFSKKLLTIIIYKENQSNNKDIYINIEELLLIQNNSYINKDYLDEIILSIRGNNLNKFKQYIELLKRKYDNASIKKTIFDILILTIAENSLDIFNFIVNNENIDINKRNYSGYTPLIYSILKGNLNIFQILLSTKNINLNTKDLYQSTPLMYAISINNDYITEILLNKEVDIYIKNKADNNALIIAIEKLNENIVKILAKYYYLNYKNLNEEIIIKFLSIFKNKLNNINDNIHSIYNKSKNITKRDKNKQLSQLVKIKRLIINIAYNILKELIENNININILIDNDYLYEEYKNFKSIKINYLISKTIKYDYKIEKYIKNFNYNNLEKIIYRNSKNTDLFDYKKRLNYKLIEILQDNSNYDPIFIINLYLNIIGIKDINEITNNNVNIIKRNILKTSQKINDLVLRIIDILKLNKYYIESNKLNIYYKYNNIWAVKNYITDDLSNIKFLKIYTKDFKNHLEDIKYYYKKLEKSND